VKPIKEPNVVDPNVFHVQFAAESKFTTWDEMMMT
jgi:hypothetical protein